MKTPTPLSLPLAGIFALLAACDGGSDQGASVVDLMRARDLDESHVAAALKTYTPTGRHDDYYVFASGGHSGQMLVIGVPSMRILKYIGVFTPGIE